MADLVHAAVCQRVGAAAARAAHGLALVPRAGLARARPRLRPVLRGPVPTREGHPRGRGEPASRDREVAGGINEGTADGEDGGGPEVRDADPVRDDRRSRVGPLRAGPVLRSPGERHAVALRRAADRGVRLRRLPGRRRPGRRLRPAASCGQLREAGLPLRGAPRRAPAGRGVGATRNRVVPLGAAGDSAPSRTDRLARRLLRPDAVQPPDRGSVSGVGPAPRLSGARCGLPRRRRDLEHRPARDLRSARPGRRGQRAPETGSGRRPRPHDRDRRVAGTRRRPRNLVRPRPSRDS